ncbi:MAG: hypothetical protein J5985_02575 [Kiritimatiellae bacterium]|nr:hypothetical protein [Kiritimatiellia bacterium]
MRPVVRYLPSGCLAAVSLDGGEASLRLFDSPQELANTRTAAPSGETALADGASALAYFFTVAPFEPAASFTLGPAVTPAFRAAFAALSGGNVRFLRGEFGAFLMGYAVDAATASFRVACITAAPRMLTVRLEDIWLALPEELRFPFYDLTLTRDPNRLDETNLTVVTETFPRQPGNLRLFLELARNGGFLLEAKK